VNKLVRLAIPLVSENREGDIDEGGVRFLSEGFGEQSLPASYGGLVNSPRSGL
jgi:hypothetical protein